MKINIGFAGLLTLIFIAAKLWDKIDWAWIWVLSPLWIGTACILALLLVPLLLAGLLLGGASLVSAFTRKPVRVHYEYPKKKKK